MASSAAGDPSPPPGGWLSGLVSGAGRVLAAVLGSESSASDATSSSPESSQSPPRRAHGAADHGSRPHSGYDNNQLNESGKEIVLKDSGESSLAINSEGGSKDVLKQLLLKETFSRSECEALIEMIQGRVVDSDPDVDEPLDALPLAWQASTQQYPVAYSSLSPNNSPPRTSGASAYSPLFDNTSEKRGLKKSSTTVEDPCTLNDLNHDKRQHAMKRGYSNTEDTFQESRRVRPKLNRLKFSEKLFDNPSSNAATFDNPVTNDAGELREFPEKYKDIPLLGTENLTFPAMDSKVETARPVQHLATTSRKAGANKRRSAMFYPYSNRDLTDTLPVKVEPFDEFAPCEPDTTHLAQKNNACTVSHDSSSVSKMMFQEVNEAAPSSSIGLQGENRSRNCKKGLNLQGNIPTKRRSPANCSRRPSNRNTIRSWKELPQQSNPASVGQEPNACHIQGKRPAVGRSRKTRRSRNIGRGVKTARRL